MVSPSATALLGLMVFLVSATPMVLAQEKVATAPPIALESVPAKVAEFEKELTAKIDAARTVIDQEVAANRLKDSVAQTLRWSLRTAAISYAGSDIRGVLATSRVPFENAPVSEACKQLETTWVSIQARYADLQKETLTESRRRALEAIKGSPKPEQVDELIRAVEEAQSALQRKYSWSSGVDYNTSLDNIEAALRSLRRLVEAEASGNLRQIITAMNSVQSMGSMDRDGGIDAELRAQVEKIRAPYVAKAEQSQVALDAALEATKPAAEVRALLEKYTEALEAVNQLRTNYDYNVVRDPTGALAMYRTAVEILTSMESKDFAAAQQQIRNARSANVQVEGRRSPKMASLLGKWEEQARVQEVQYVKGQVESWRSRIQKVSQPSDLDDLAVEITRVEQQDRGENRKPEVPAGLGATLSRLAAAWQSLNPGFLRDERMQSGNLDERQGPFAAELGALRRRIEREVFVSVLRVPELNQPPLADKPPQQAVEELVRQSAQKKEWRRVIELLQASRQLKGEDPRGDTELLEALRSYLAGQNLELAEQWSDAAAAYKRVLLCTSELAPVADAADRLKALKREHPEAASPSNAGRPLPGVIRN
jgi:hypothetical protein